VLTGTFSLWHATEDFFIAGGGGILFGLGIGWVSTQVQARLDDPPVQTTLSLLTPFAAYLPADHLGLSGVFVVVSAGIFVGWRAPEIITPAPGCRRCHFGRSSSFCSTGWCLS